MKIITWNCQGAASKEFICVLKKFIKHNKPNIIALLEPRISGDHADKVCKKADFESWVRIEALGFNSGIWVLWRDGILVEVLHTHPQFMVLKVSDGLMIPWYLGIVYGSQDHGLRKRLWMDLNVVSLGIEGPLMVLGDFNSVVSAEEVSSQDSWTAHRFLGFRDWIFEQGLLDMGFCGHTFTWTRRVHASTFKGVRLDFVMWIGAFGFLKRLLHIFRGLVRIILLVWLIV